MKHFFFSLMILKANIARMKKSYIGPQENLNVTFELAWVRISMQLETSRQDGLSVSLWLFHVILGKCP